ncbi:MAG: SpoIIE family protein phosphatase [Candidatus Zixiibacteriota bacterium]|nr:MAG: SpoIIE family protein phosphatase [candidate division Zixibacteria bacterium]
MHKLVGTDGGKFYSWLMKPGRYRVGRKAGSDFCVPHRTVSRAHAEFEVTPAGKCFLTDLGSRNGTFVNGERIESRVPLGEGDSVLFGQTEFKLVSADESEPPTSGLPRIVLAQDEPRNSVFLAIDEALKPLPPKATDLPGLLPALFEMARTQDFTESQEAMLLQSLKTIAGVIPSDRLAVLFVSDNQQEVYTAASLVPEGQDPGEMILSRTIVNEIMTNKNAILISDPKDDPRFAEQKSIIMSELKSAIAVPLFDENKVLGILYIDTTNPLHRYSDEYLRVLATFGNIIASRLLNYALLDERQEKQVMEAELARAAAIQKELLVSSPPPLPGYSVYALLEQSRSVGGDLYDFRLLPDGQMLFMVADVSGKGLGAALLGSNILASFRILYDEDGFALADAVLKVSLQLFHNSSPGDFATLFAGVLDPVTGGVRYINAGHNPPLIVHAGGTVEYLETSGTMIGAFDFSTWEEHKIVLSPEDLLFIFTDGVTEADRDTGEGQYGERRMERLVIEARRETPREISCRLIADINDFMEGTPRSDDITMLIIRRDHNEI